MSNNDPKARMTEQRYYWTPTWQTGERESLAQLTRGDFRIFTDPVEAVRYLLSFDRRVQPDTVSTNDGRTTE